MRKKYTLLKKKYYPIKKSKFYKIILILRNPYVIFLFVLFISIIISIFVIFIRKYFPNEKNDIINNQINNSSTKLLKEIININDKNNYIDIMHVQNTVKYHNDNNNTSPIIDSKYSKRKLYWKSPSLINLIQIREEIKTYKHIKITFENKTDFIKREKPKVSLIITAHNQEKNIITIYASIQRQELKDIEIIFIDDASKDNTSLSIQELMKYDNRIVYLKNDINKRAFYSRNKGILNAKGEYILVIDPDDLLLNNILIKAYETAKKYNLDIVQFYAMIGIYQIPRLWRDVKYKEGILRNNQEIRENFYQSFSRNLWDKLVRREVYLKSIEFMKDEYKNELYFLNNDDTAFFGLVHVADTFGFLEEVGYFYILRPRYVYDYRSDPKNTNLIFRSIFNNMKYFYMQSDDTVADKRNMAYKYFDKSFKDLKKNMDKLSADFDFILEVLELYLNSSYFNESQKKKLYTIKSMVIERKNELIKI